MIECSLDKQNSILTLYPTAALEAGDFKEIAQVVDPYIEETGHLTGLLIEAPSFPGWENFKAMKDHFGFIRGHHKFIKKVALVTDSPLGTLGEHLASHFVSAEINHFPAADSEAARQWLTEPA